MNLLTEKLTKTFSKTLAVISAATLIALFSVDASAQSSRGSSYGSPTYSGDSFSTRAGTKVISGAVGLFSSGVGLISDGDFSAGSSLSGFYGIGGDFDFFLDSDFSVGGILRYYNTSDTVARVDYTNSLTTLGGVARAHLASTKNFLVSATAGAGMTDASVKVGTRTVGSGMALSLYMGLSLFYKLNRNTAIGVENLRVLGLGEKINGWVLSDYMFKLAFAL